MAYATEVRVNRRLRELSPEKRGVMADGLETIVASLPSLDTTGFYKGLLQFSIPMIFGDETPLPDWESAPVMSNREKRYLSVLNKMANNLECGDFDQVKMTIRGFSSFYGSRVDSGGIPCSPELLLLCGYICKGLDRLLDSDVLTKKRVYLIIRNNLKEVVAELIRGVTFEYLHTDVDRSQLASSLFNFQETVETSLWP